MKVRLLVSRATAHGPQNRDDEIEVSAAEGLRMIEAGQAVALAAAPETAAADPAPETRKGKGK